MANILVPDYPGQQMIAGIKQLYKNGDSCDLAWDLKPFNYLFKSKYISNYIKIPKLDEHIDKYIQGVVELISKESYDLLLPFGNNACHAICMAQESVKKHIKILTPSKRSHQIAYNKYLTYKHCRKINIPVPQTFSQFKEDDLTAIANSLLFPVVIKTISGTGVKRGLRYANSIKELIKQFNVLNKGNKSIGDKPNLIIQEFIPGYIHDACAVAADGKVLQSLTQVRHWMYPITGGVGAINYTTKNESVRDLAEKVLESLSWSGPAQIEFKYDERDHQYKLIEINPKFWGTLDLSIQSGVNFPLIIRDFVLENRVVPVDYQPDNFYFFYFPQAFTAGIQSVRKFGFKSLKINQNMRKKFSDIDLSDPKPVFYRALKTFGDIILRRTTFPSAILKKQNINQ